jgi:predicted KAP-like P-loop ATPase
MNSQEKNNWSLSEEPISSDGQDSLQRKVLAETIANILCEYKDGGGRVYSIIGNWGVGKTSLVNLIKKIIDDKEDHKVDYFDFKPWALGGAENITREFFNEIFYMVKSTNRDEFKKKEKWGRATGAFLKGSRTLSVKDDKIAEFLGNINKIFGFFGFVGFLPPALLSFVDDYSKYFGLGISAVLILIGFLGKRMFDFWTEFNKRSLDDYQNELKDFLDNRDRPLVAFIDDIDRLDKEEIRALIRQVKGRFNFNNIIFVLIYQQSIVEAALTDGETIKGKEFLEKIILCNFSIPPIPMRLIHDLFNEKLTEMLKSLDERPLEGKRFEQVIKACIYPYIRHVRDVRRLLSSIYINLQMHRTVEVREVNMVDFIGLESVRFFLPDLHKELYKNRRIVLREDVVGVPDVTDEDVDSLFSNLDAPDRQVAREAMASLFPKIRPGISGVVESALTETQTDRRNCVSNGIYFDMYFHFQRFPGEVSQLDAKKLLSIVDSSSDFKKLLKEFCDSNTLKELIEVIIDYVQDKNETSTEVFLKVLFGILEDIEFAWGDDALSSDIIQVIRRVIKDSNPEDNLHFFKNFTEFSEKNLLVYLMIVAWEARLHSQRYAVEDFVEGRQTTLEQKVLEKINGMINEEDRLAKSKYASLFLCYWNMFESQRSIIENFVRNRDKDTDGLNLILNALCGYGLWENGRFEILRSGEFSRPTLKRFFDLTDLESRLDEMNFEDYPEYMEKLTSLKAHLENWRETDKALGIS